MEKDRLPERLRKPNWREANVRLVPSAVLFITGAILSSEYGNVRTGKLGHKLVALFGLLVFIFFATAFLRVFTTTICRFAGRTHLSAGRTASLQFVLRIIGYITIFLTTLDLLSIPVGKLLLGGAAVGIILGVAAQQSLANFFASVVMIIAHPFSVGDHIIINSGGLGGRYDGTVKDIGLTHTRLELTEDNTIVLLPNTALLSGAAIISAAKAPVHDGDSKPKANI